MKRIIVSSAEPVRLDRYIKRLFPSATQGLIESYLRNGKIKLNNTKSKSNTRVSAGDEITLFGDLFQNLEQAKNFSNSTKSLALKLLDDYLLLSTNEFIAINKPHNLAVQGGSKVRLSIDDAISYLNTTTGTDFKLVHRLDKGTSGVLIIARGYDNAAKLAKSFKDKIIQKTYSAVVWGHLKESQGIVINYISKDRSGVFEIVKESKEGKRAETHYKVLKESNSYSLVEFKPITGRMHQLRVHSKILGCPILGDTKYGGLKYKRIMLHAQQIIIPQEVFGVEIVVKSNIPEIWRDLNKEDFS